MMKFMAVLLALAAATVMAACDSGSDVQVTPPADADVTITASGSDFDKSEVEVPAGEAFQLFFDNQDNASHNVAVYTDSSADESLFVGERVRDTSVVYEVPALEPGEYFFRCDVHPNMRGTMVADD